MKPQKSPSTDSFQIYEVVRTECLILEVTIVGGRKISMGWLTFLDTPDPYVQVTVPDTVGETRRTKAYDNNVQPDWNETFVYHIHPKKRPKIVLDLMDANVILKDKKIGLKEVDISDLELGKYYERNITFPPHKSEVDIRIHLREDYQPSEGIRFGNELSVEEHRFRTLRSQHVYDAMKELLGETGPKDLCETPCISILGSGGGFRAMTALGGVMKALADTKILDCATYNASLSGSTWYFSSLYSHPDFPNTSAIHQVQEELKESTNQSLSKTLFTAPKYFGKLWKKCKGGLPVAFTDLFGYLVGGILLKDRTEAKLSEQREKIADARMPMPLYTCAHVKADQSAASYHDWVEFNPNEVSVPKYGLSLDSKLFCSKFYRGRLVKEEKEPPLSYLLGIWGSAYTILLNRVFNTQPAYDEKKEIDQEQLLTKFNDDYNAWTGKDRKGEGGDDSDDEEDADLDEVDGFKDDIFKLLAEKFSMMDHRGWRSAKVPNFLRGLSLAECSTRDDLHTMCDNDEGCQCDGQSCDLDGKIGQDEENMEVVDAGLAFNLPYPLLLRSQRNVQLILSFEFSARDSDDANPLMVLAEAKQWADTKGLRFPPIDVDRYNPDKEMETMYIFKDDEDPMCPVILHFPVANTSFRKFKAPGVPRETEEELDFANFDIFSEDSPYGSSNFQYSHLAFDRLTKLAEYNTLLHVDDIKAAMAEAVTRKKLLNDSPSTEVDELKRGIQRSVSWSSNRKVSSNRPVSDLDKLVVSLPASFARP